MSTKLPFITERLFCPGPTPVPLQSRLLMVDQVPYHRNPNFCSTFLNCREMLMRLCGSENPPVILTSSGTGAMEAAVVNFTEAGDEVLCLVGGKFGERWQDLARAYGCRVHPLEFPWGKAPAPEQVARYLQKEKGIKAVFFQHCETSTGVALPVPELAAAVARHSQALVVVDGISSLGAHPMRMKEWGVDVMVAGSQKGLATPPGLAFIAFSPRAMQHFSSRPKFYFDLPSEAAQQKNGQTNFTPASGLIVALEAALQQITAYGIDEYSTHHRKLAEALRTSLKSIGLELLGEGCFACSVTAAYVPQGIDGKKLVALLQEKYAMIFAGGQDRLQGRIIRFAHLGMIDYFDICAGIIALEQALTSLGFKAELGAGIATFMGAF